MPNITRSLKPGTWVVLVNDGLIHIGMMADSSDRGCNVGVYPLGFTDKADEVLMCFFPWEHVQGVWAIGDERPDWKHLDKGEAGEVLSYVNALYTSPPVMTGQQDETISFPPKDE